MTVPKPQPAPTPRDVMDVNRGLAVTAQHERDEWRDAAKGLAEEVGDVRRWWDEDRATLARVTALHQPDGHACTCGTTRPCDTTRALEGR